MVSDQATILDKSNWDGSLSSSDFYAASCAFAEKWNKFDPAFPEWSWVHSSKGRKVAAGKVEGYLALQNVLLPNSLQEHDEDNHYQNEDPNFSDTDEPIDAAVLVQRNNRNMHHYDFHIANSTSYRVPVLYFHASDSDGQPLTLDDIEKDLPPDSAKILIESKWTFITQVEHPYLNRPWYSLHPCGTSEWMKLLLDSAAPRDTDGVSVAVEEQYLISWFSVVGQVFGFRIPFKMLPTFHTSS